MLMVKICNGECEQCSTWAQCGNDVSQSIVTPTVKSLHELVQQCYICNGRGWNPMEITRVHDGRLLTGEVRVYCDTCKGSGTIFKYS